MPPFWNLKNGMPSHVSREQDASKKFLLLIILVQLALVSWNKFLACI